MCDQTEKYHVIKYLFEPRHVAIIGASANKKKIGFKIVENIRLGGFKGKVYPINPKEKELMGFKAYKSIGDITDEKEIDMALICVPEPIVLDAVKTCVSKKVKYILVITSGFSEIGKNKEEKEIVEFAQDHGMRILGPNIFGAFINKSDLNASFASSIIPKGHVALISQSGALGAALIGETGEENIGLSSMIPLGNKADVDESDLLEYLMDDESTKVILIYMEGVKNGERLISVLKKTTQKKPVIVIKSGRSKKGALAAASHTGSLSGSDEVFQAIMNQCNVHRPEDIAMALQWAKYLAESPVPKGENSIIITNGGGVGVMAADACEKYGVQLFDNYQTLYDVFSPFVPEFGSIKNPIDITGQVGIEGYEKCIQASVNHPDIHSIICLGCEHALFNEEALKTTIERIHKKYGKIKPILYVFYGGKAIKNAIKHLKSLGIPIYGDLYQAISCLGELYKDYRHKIMLESTTKELDTENIEINYDGIEKILHEVKEDNRKFLLADEARRMMDYAGIPMPKSIIATNMASAVEFAKEIGWPVAMKIVSKDILHKSDAGGVVLNLENETEIMDAWQAIMLSCRKYDPLAKIKGIEICEMIKIETETIVGGRRDPNFGPTLMFGSGGIYVEILKDVAFRALSFSRHEIMGMLKETRLYPLLLGVRGETKKDINAIVDIIIRVAMILRKFDQVTDIEINPLVAYEEGRGVKAVDARILIK
ncbi:MAG: acetate--CoA ligase family protein [Bacteriovoracaceae bacterium]|nr:acetate--CoA ligase family protein [Bacteriovoracaceae bacterium]